MINKIAIFGYGRIGKIHYQNLVRNINSEVVAVVDPYINEDDEMFLENQDVSVYRDSNSAFAHHLDAIYICSASDTHVDIALQAIAKNINIFCEKPVDKDINKVKLLMKALEDKNLIFQLGFNRRFDHNFKAVKDAIVAGKIGDVHSLKITSRDPEAPPLSYVEVSGGIFNDMTIHDFDMIRYLSDKKIKTIYAVGGALIDPRIAQYNDVDSAMVMVSFTDGSNGVIDNSRQAVYGYDQRAEVFGSKGQVKIENDSNSTISLSNNEGVASDKPLYFFLERYMESFEIETSSFINCLVNKQKPIVDLEDGLIAMLMAVAAKRSLDSNSPIDFEDLIKEYNEKGL